MNYWFDCWDKETEINDSTRIYNNDSLQYFSIDTIVSSFKEALVIYNSTQLKDCKNITNLMILKEYFVADVSLLIMKYYTLLFDQHIISFNRSCGPLEKLLELKCKISIKCISHYVKSFVVNADINHYGNSEYIQYKRKNNLKLLNTEDLLNKYPLSKDNNILLINSIYSIEYYNHTVSILYFDIVKKLQPSCILLVGNSKQLDINQNSTIFNFINFNDKNEAIVYNVDKINMVSDGRTNLGYNMLIILSKYI